MNNITRFTWKKSTDYGDATVTVVCQPNVADKFGMVNYVVDMTVVLDGETLTERIETTLADNVDINEWYLSNTRLRSKQYSLIDSVIYKVYSRRTLTRSFNMEITRSKDEILKELQDWNECVARDPSRYDIPQAHAIIDFWDWLTTKD